MSNLVIVAIPDENDRVWKVSSEKVPHLTLLYLGDVNEVKNLQKVVEYVEHAANTTLNRFYLSVDRRGELGADQADVLFFRRSRYSDYSLIRDFRMQLLKDPNIRTAHDSATQWEGPWTPHLTLGYPAQPARPDDTDRDYGFYDVAFTKIAIWTDDYEGPEFLLKDYWDEWDALETAPLDAAMSAMGVELIRSQHGHVIGFEMADDPVKHNDVDGAEFLVRSGIMTPEQFLEHYGVKGMRWGHRKAEPEAITPVAVSRVPQGDKRKTKIDVEGGENHPAHTDAVKVAEARAKLTKSGAAALSNSELRDVANRLQLEQQVKSLTENSGKKFVKGFFKNQGQQSAERVVRRKAMSKGF